MNNTGCSKTHHALGTIHGARHSPPTSGWSDSELVREGRRRDSTDVSRVTIQKEMFQHTDRRSHVYLRDTPSKSTPTCTHGKFLLPLPQAKWRSVSSLPQKLSQGEVGSSNGDLSMSNVDCTGLVGRSRERVRLPVRIGVTTPIFPEMAVLSP